MQQTAEGAFEDAQAEWERGEWAAWCDAVAGRRPGCDPFEGTFAQWLDECAEPFPTWDEWCEERADEAREKYWDLQGRR